MDSRKCGQVKAKAWLGNWETEVSSPVWLQISERGLESLLTDLMCFLTCKADLKKPPLSLSWDVMKDWVKKVRKSGLYHPRCCLPQFPPSHWCLHNLIPLTPPKGTEGPRSWCPSLNNSPSPCQQRASRLTVFITEKQNCQIYQTVVPSFSQMWTSAMQWITF